MPRMCSVYGCKSNYRSQGDEAVTTFSLPKDEELRKKLLRKIPNDISKLKNPVVCRMHFEESKVITVDKVHVRGELKEFPRIVPKLSDDAVPTIFQNAASYLTTYSSTVKRLPDFENEQLEEALNQSIKEPAKVEEVKKTNIGYGSQTVTCMKRTVLLY